MSLQQSKDYEDFIQISLLSQFFYCKRRCSLILLENLKDSNIYTVNGTIKHQTVHSSKIEKRPGISKIFNMQLYSEKYKLIGKSDCVEFYDNPNGTLIDILNDKFDIVPIEYKSGRARDEKEYQIQLAAQAMCLEEMYKTKINRGYLYYMDSNARVEVPICDELRQKVIFGVDEIYKIILEEIMHTPVLKKGCPKCSFFEKCNPKIITVKHYVDDMWRCIN